MEERLQAAQIKINIACDAVREDDGASPVLTAVVNEFAKKGEKAAQLPDERVAVIELEQAGDSAKVAVEADPGVTRYSGRHLRSASRDLYCQEQTRSVTPQGVGG
jgi:hypothetical protein